MLDQLSKALVASMISPVSAENYHYPYNGIGVIDSFVGFQFSLNYMTNTGAAWGIGSNHPLILLGVRVGLIILLCSYLVSLNRTSYCSRLPLLLIIAGAVGNVTDYFVYGHVVDMFHVTWHNYDFPVFNVADSAISIGIASWCVMAWLMPQESP